MIGNDSRREREASREIELDETELALFIALLYISRINRRWRVSHAVCGWSAGRGVAQTVMEVCNVIQDRPRGLLRALFRLPVYLYLLDLGWLLDHRFLMVTHQGRKSGLVRRTVLEVLHHDRVTGESIVMAAYGERADWLRNIRHGPPLEVQIGRRRYVPAYQVLSDEEAPRFLEDWQEKHPLEAAIGSRIISGHTGQWGDIKLVRFYPASSAGGLRSL